MISSADNYLDKPWMVCGITGRKGASIRVADMQPCRYISLSRRGIMDLFVATKGTVADFCAEYNVGAQDALWLNNRMGRYNDQY